MLPTPRRIHIIGTTCTGKTTLARRIAEHLDIHHVELDAIRWGPGWALPEKGVFRTKAAQVLGGDTWVVDGNYSEVRDIVWARVEMVIWLDYPFLLVFWRLLWRTMRRVLMREELWHGNRESIYGAFFAKDSLLRYVIRTYRRRRMQYAALMAAPDYSHINFVRLRSPREEEKLINELADLQ